MSRQDHGSVDQIGANIGKTPLVQPIPARLPHARPSSHRPHEPTLEPATHHPAVGLALGDEDVAGGGGVEFGVLPRAADEHATG